MKRARILFAALLVVTFILSACGGTASPSSSPSSTPSQSQSNATPAPSNQATPAPVAANVKDTIIVAMGGEPSTLDGNGKNDSSSSIAKRQIFDTLVTQDENLQVIPSIAESWEQVDDTTVKFNIRKGVKFHDGSELKASDVLFSIKRAYDLGFASGELSAIDFDNCVAEDDYTYVLKLQYPFAPIVANLCTASAAIVPQAVVEKVGDEEFAVKPVGSGPYMLKEWFRGDRIEFTAFNEYWGGAPATPNLVIRFIGETTTRAIEVESGGVDIALGIATNDVERLESNPNVVMNRKIGAGVEYIAFNTEKTPFEDARVRRAVAMALDTPSIVKAVYTKVGQPAQSMLPPSTFGFDPSIELIPYDVEGAKALLAEAGYAEGFSTQIWVANTNQARMDIAEIMQNQLKAVNIDAKVNVVDWGSGLLIAIENHTTDIFILGTAASTGDGDCLYQWFESTGHFSSNTSYYKNADMDALLLKSRQETDSTKRLALLKEIQEKMIQESPWIPYYNGEVINATTKKVQGFVTFANNVQQRFNTVTVEN